MKTKTAVIYGVNDVRVCERELREVKENHVLIKVGACNLCTSEYGIYGGGRSNRKLPMTFGHEWAGTVVEVGSNVKSVKVGDFVGGNYEYDVYSEEARNGFTSVAPGIKSYDTTWSDGFYGRYEGCSEYVLLSQEAIYKFDNKISYSEAGFLEPLATVVSGIEKLKLSKNQNVLIIGAGTMGILNALVCKYEGYNVFVSEMMSNKIEKAKEYDLNVIDLNVEDLIESLKDKTNGAMMDAVIVAAGSTKANQQGFAALKKNNGKILLFAAGYPSPEVGVDANFIHYGNTEVYGTFLADYHHFKHSAFLLANGHVKVDKLIDNTYTLDKVKEALDEANVPGKYRISVVME